MASYDEIVGSLQPSDLDRRDAQTQALMMAAAGALQGGPTRGSMLANTIFAGMQGYNDSMSSARKQRLEQMMLRKQAAELADYERKKQDEATLADAMRQSASGAGTAQAPSFQPGSVQPLAIAPDLNAGPPAPPQAPAGGQREQRRQMLQRTIDNLIQRGAGNMAVPLQAELAKMDDEYATEPRYDQSGNAFLVSKQGGMKPLAGVKARDEIVGDNLGDVERYRTKYSLNPLGIVGRGQSPDSAASNAVTMRGQNMVDSRAADTVARGRVQYDAERGGMVNLDTGEFTPATQGGAPIAPKMPESQKKEITGIDQQLGVVAGARKAVKDVPSAFGKMRGAATMAGSLPESIAGSMTTPAEQQARSYVFNVVSKVINERAGAAQSTQELARLRSFLPGELDSDKQIDSKLQAFEQYLNDSRGAVAGSNPTRPAAAPPAASGPPPIEQRKLGQVYEGPNGKMKWMGNGWLRVGS